MQSGAHLWTLSAFYLSRRVNPKINNNVLHAPWLPHGQPFYDVVNTLVCVRVRVSDGWPPIKCVTE